MDDLIYIGVAAVFFVLSWALLKMCDVLQPVDHMRAEEKSGGPV